MRYEPELVAGTDLTVVSDQETAGANRAFATSEDARPQPHHRGSVEHHCGTDALDRVGSDFSEYSNTSRRIAELMPDATVIEMPDVKHWPHFEDAARFNEIAIGFLLGVSGKLG